MKGFYSKKATEPKKILREFRVNNIGDYKEGNEIGLEYFKDQKFVDVTAKTIGKGFAGVMKKYNFAGLRATHGVSVSHRSHGSTGQRQDPGKVFKGKKMAGHMGDKLRTMLNLEIIKSDLENNLLYLRGSIPGSKNTTVLLRESIKNISKKKGIFIQKLCFVSSNVNIGDGVKINVGAQIHHDVSIEKYCTIAPRAVILGSVKIGKYTYVGANSTIKQNVKIGKNVIIGAGAVVVNDIKNNQIVAGNPAKKIKI